MLPWALTFLRLKIYADDAAGVHVEVSVHRVAATDLSRCAAGVLVLYARSLHPQLATVNP